MCDGEESPLGIRKSVFQHCIVKKKGFTGEELHGIPDSLGIYWTFLDKD